MYFYKASLYKSSSRFLKVLETGNLGEFPVVFHMVSDCHGLTALHSWQCLAMALGTYTASGHMVPCKPFPKATHAQLIIPNDTHTVSQPLKYFKLNYWDYQVANLTSLGFH